MNEITIGDKIYISAKRAAEITGYARDYVGQLCREGHVDAKMVGRSWYVFEPSIRAHRFGVEPEAAVEAPITNQSEVVEATATQTSPVAAEGEWAQPKYTPESTELLPEMAIPTIEEVLPPAEETLTDMQSAWREWFEQKQNVLATPEIETPAVIDARNEVPEVIEEPVLAPEMAQEEPAFEVPLRRIEEEQPIVEEQVPIHHIYQAPEPQYVDIRREAAPEPVYINTPSRYSAEYAAPQAEHGRIIEERIIPKQAKGRSNRGAPARARRTNAPIIALLVAISFISIAVAAVGTGYAGRYVKNLPAKNNPVINFLVGAREFSR